MMVTIRRAPWILATLMLVCASCGVASTDADLQSDDALDGTPGVGSADSANAPSASVSDSVERPDRQVSSSYATSEPAGSTHSVDTSPVASTLPVGRPEFESLESPRRCEDSVMAEGPVSTTIDEILAEIQPDEEVAIMQIVSVSDGATLVSQDESIPDDARARFEFETVDVVYRVLEVLSPDSPVEAGDTLRVALVNPSRDDEGCAGDEPDVGTVEIHFYTRDLSSYANVEPERDVDAISLHRLGIHRNTINAYAPIMYRTPWMASFDGVDATEFVDDLTAALRPAGSPVAGRAAPSGARVEPCVPDEQVHVGAGLLAWLPTGTSFVSGSTADEAPHAEAGATFELDGQPVEIWRALHYGPDHVPSAVGRSDGAVAVFVRTADADLAACVLAGLSYDPLLDGE